MFSLPGQLVAGSGANQDRDESSNIAPVEAESTVVHDVSAKEDGYSVGVPGPLTRIFVIANRGVANLVQDLILVSSTCRFSNGTVIINGTVYCRWWREICFPTYEAVSVYLYRITKNHIRKRIN